MAEPLAVVILLVLAALPVTLVFAVVEAATARRARTLRAGRVPTGRRN